MTCRGLRCLRHILFFLVVAGLLVAPAGPSAAQTTTTTGVTVEVIDAGAFSVEIASEGIAFSTEEGLAPSVTAFAGATAYATLPIKLTDTRSDETRGGYEVRLAMSPLTSGDDASQTVIIDAGNVQVVGVDGLPEGLSPEFEGNSSLESPVAIFASGEVSPAAETTIEVSLQLEIPPGTMPGNFSGEIWIEIIPII